MKRILLCLLIVAANISVAQELYVRAFGRANDPAIIFLHGGPGFHCRNFELTTAQKLADKGYYVIVYDRQGEGRSPSAKALFTFEQTISDLDRLYTVHGIKKATLIGHSFGGVVAAKYADQHPDKVRSVILVGAPVVLQQTFKTIIKHCKKIYTEKNDTANLKLIAAIEKMDTSSLFYTSLCFSHAMSNGFYKPGTLAKEAETIYKDLKADSSNKAPQVNAAAPMGFLQKEKFTTLDITPLLRKMVAEKKVRIYGLYGKDDGLYSAEVVQKIGALIGDENLLYVDNCSHNVFMDQQAQFFAAIEKWTAK